MQSKAWHCVCCELGLFFTGIYGAHATYSVYSVSSLNHPQLTVQVTKENVVRGCMGCCPEHPCNYSWQVHTERRKENQGKSGILCYIENTGLLLGTEQIICHQREAGSAF